jgi:RNA polymerase sigma-70 factor (ECF subfamily)
MSNSEDIILVELLKRSGFSAFDALFHKYSSSLYAFALSITRNQFAAEEITQLVFLKIWEKRAKIDQHFSFKSFLFSVAYHETISWLRKEDSEKRRIGTYAQIASHLTNETEYAVEFSNLEMLVESLIDSMPEKRKEIFRLSREQGFSNKEIAEKLNISIKTVENQMTSALKYLREKLGKQELMGILFYFFLLQ